jgi:hypothetical protein
MFLSAAVGKNAAKIDIPRLMRRVVGYGTGVTQNQWVLPSGNAVAYVEPGKATKRRGERS